MTVSSRRRSVSLGALREDTSATQVAIADRLGMSQGEVSRLERRSDLRVSTLVRYVESLRGRLEIVVWFPKGCRVHS